MTNLDIYNKVKSVPKEALTEIKAGRLKGKSNINPQWRIQVLTETFGVCGFGWKYKITKQWIEEGANGERAAFVNIELFIKVGDEWSDAIPGTGGNSLVANELKGLRTSDEAYKMALTDALSVSCKAIGIAADVYWEEGDKYTMQDKEETEAETDIEILSKVKNILWIVAEKDNDKLIKLLEEYTSFKGRDGKQVKGLTDFKELKDKRLRATYGKLQKKYPDIYKLVKEKADKKKKTG